MKNKLVCRKSRSETSFLTHCLSHSAYMASLWGPILPGKNDQHLNQTEILPEYSGELNIYRIAYKIYVAF